MKHLKIGNVELENRYILGPMAGVTDLPFRLLCQGAGGRSSLHGDGQRQGNLLQ